MKQTDRLLVYRPVKIFAGYFEKIQKRGNFEENIILETVLKNVLPPGFYQMQYEFKNGEIVDAVVFVG